MKIWIFLTILLAITIFYIVYKNLQQKKNVDIDNLKRRKKQSKRNKEYWNASDFG